MNNVDSIQLKEWSKEFEDILYDVFAEMDNSDKVHGEKFYSTKEWYGVLKEEFDELWDKIKETKGEISCTYAMKKEAIQCIAMLLKGMRGFTKGEDNV